MGRRKAKKPGRKKPLPWVIAQPTPPYRNIKPVTIPPGNHTLEVDLTSTDDLGTIHFEDGGKVVLEDATATVLATDPITITELANLIDNLPSMSPPSDERAEYVADILHRGGYLEGWDWVTRAEDGRLIDAYKVTEKGHAYLRAMMRARSMADLPPPILATDEADDDQNIYTDDDAAFMLLGYLFAELMKEQRPGLAEKLLPKAANPALPKVVADMVTALTNATNLMEGR